MDKYLYRTNNGEIFSYYVSNNVLYENKTNNSTSNDNEKKEILKDIRNNISPTVTRSGRPNIFYKELNNSKTIFLCEYIDNYWVTKPFFSYNANIEYFKVVQFKEKYALIFSCKSNQKQLSDLFICYVTQDSFTTPQKIDTAYSLTNDIFKIEELSMNHFAILYKTFENKKMHLKYVEVNADKFSKSVILTTSEYQIYDDSYLFSDKIYCIYTKIKSYSNQLCLKIISDFNNIPNEEISIFETKKIAKSSIFVANNIPNISFSSNGNMMIRRISDDDTNKLTKMEPLHQTSATLSKIKMIGYSLPSDNFVINNLYCNEYDNIEIVDKFCNILDISKDNKYNNTNLDFIEERNQALIEENRQLKKQLLKYDSI